MDTEDGTAEDGMAEDAPFRGMRGGRRGQPGPTLGHFTLLKYLMELLRIFVRKFRATCTSFSAGIVCVTISTIFIFLHKRGRVGRRKDTHTYTLSCQAKSMRNS